MLQKKMKKEIDLNYTQKEMRNIVKCKVNNLHGFKGWIDLLEDEKLRDKLEDGSKIAGNF